MIDAVFFDVGETLVDETRLWAVWADRIGVPRFTFAAVLGQVVERGQEHRAVFELLAPGLDVDAEIEAMLAEGVPIDFAVDDLYPDAVPCLQAVAASGRLVGVVGNQPESSERIFTSLGLHLDVLASSARWSVAKPSPAFFQRLVAEAGRPPERIAYVGDRLDNDVLPAVAAGLRAVLVRRGPWAWSHVLRSEVAAASAVIDRLDDLVPLLAAW